MSTHDTDPQGAPPLDYDCERTEPRPPPEPAARPPTGLAADLLAHLSDVPLPERGVAETEGHDAAQFAVAPHAPPRRAADHDAEPAVIVNVTEPLPIPVANGADAERNVATADRGATTLPVRSESKRSRIVVGACVLAAATIALAGFAARKPELPVAVPSPTASSPSPPSGDSPAAPPSLVPVPVEASAAAPHASAQRIAPRALVPPRPPMPSASTMTSASKPAVAPAPTTKYNRFLEEDSK